MNQRHAGAAISLVSSIIIIIWSSEATAQAGVPTSLQQLVLTPSYQANIARLFAQLHSDVFHRCPTLVSRGSTTTIIEPPIFAADGYPTSGFWRQSFPVSGCGNDTIINFFFKASADEKVLSIVAAPGSTHADLALQKDAMSYAFIAAQAKANGCSSLNIRTTIYTGIGELDPKKSAKMQPWRETWTISGCGQLYDVPMTFIPDASGTTISAAPAQLVRP